MKKTILATSLAAAMSVATTADAAFTPMGDGDYKMEITSGCFFFGNCVVGGSGDYTDNTTANQADTSAFGFPGGSGIINDGFMGVIDFTLTAGNITVSSFSQDSYLATAGGTFYLRAPNLTTMGGTIDAAGNMSFNPDGRVGLAATVSTTEQPWNFDDSAFVQGTSTNTFDQWVTGTSTGLVRTGAIGLPISKTGSILQDDSANVRSGRVVVSSNVGDAWGSGFTGIAYTEEFNVTISLVLGLPKAVEDLVTTSPSTQVTIDIAADLMVNDTHADVNETLSFNAFTQPVSGGSTTLVYDALASTDGTLTYSPDPALIGANADSFTYTINDGANALSTVTVTINVATGAAPVAVADNPPAFDEDTALTLDPILNDTDVNPTDTLVLYNFVDGITAKSGAYAAAGGNNVTYTPAPNFNGTDTFNYQVHDGNGNVETGVITVTVAPVNDAPVCSDVSFITPLDTAFSITEEGLLSKTTIPPLCTDIEGDALSIAAFDTMSTSGGTISSDGATPEILTYTPKAGYQGTDTFTFIATDTTDSDIPRTVTVLVGSDFGNFTMLRPAPDGGVFGGTNDVNFVWDGKTFNTDESDANFSLMTIASDGPHPFFGSAWIAHNIRVYGPGTYTFDTTCTVTQLETGISDCMNPLDAVNGQTERYMTMTVGADQVGAHLLFDWSTSTNIDVVNVWNKEAAWVDPDGTASPKNDLWLGAAGASPDPSTLWSLVSTDVNGDGFNGSPMIDGPFIGYYANFNDSPAGSLPPPPPITTTISDTSLSSLGLWSLVTGLITLLFTRRKVSLK